MTSGGIIWIMAVMICHGPPTGCVTEIVRGYFQTRQQCKEIGNILRDKRVSFVCLPTWEKRA